MAPLGLPSRGRSLVVLGPPTAVASRCAARASVLATHWLSACCTQAWLPGSIWTHPGPGIEPVSLALAGRFLTTGSPEKPPVVLQCLSAWAPLMLFHLKLEFGLIRGDTPASVRCVRGCVLQMFTTGIADLNYLVKVSARIPHYLLLLPFELLNI